MSTGDKILYAAALAVAQALATILAPVCERVLIAGSLRRQKEEVGDLELVVLPKTEAILDLFGEPCGERSLLDDALADIAPVRTKDGERYKQFMWEGMPVDLFIATRDTWGCVATIRTGSADFTRWLVTSRRQGGACPSHLNFKEGRLWLGETALETPEELDVFDALNQRWIEPIERIAGRWRS
jgi:DNA polymerase/3'-5' exonuclease PolX